MLIAIIVFFGIFAVIALLLAAVFLGSSGSKEARAHLETALSNASATVSSELKVDVRKADLVSTIPWIDRTLRSLKVASRLRRLLYQANLNWSPGIFLLSIAAFFLVPAYVAIWRTGNIICAIVAGLACAYAPIAFINFRRKKRFAAFEEGLPEALGLMVNGLRAGHSLVSVLRVVAKEAPAPIGPEFLICFEEQNYGLELRTAMENMAERFPIQDLRIAMTAILIQKESGGNLAEVLEKTSNVIRERATLKRQVRVHSAQSRLTGLILSLLPLLLGVAMYFVDPQMISILWTRRIGQELLLLAGVMTLIGGFIISKIVNLNV